MVVSEDGSMERPLRDGVTLIGEERERQIVQKGFDPEHDMELHSRNTELVEAAIAYARYAGSQIYAQNYNAHSHEWLEHPREWPWDVNSWHPDPDPVRNLEKAGALIAAQIDVTRRARVERVMEKDKLVVTLRNVTEELMSSEGVSGLAVDQLFAAARLAEGMKR